MIVKGVIQQSYKKIYAPVGTTTWGQRLKQLQEELMPNAQNAFAREIGVSEQSFSGWVNDQVKKVPSDLLSKISDKYPMVDTDWIVSGRGAMYHPGQNDGAPGPAPGPPDAGTRTIPVASEGHGAGTAVVNEGPATVMTIPETVLRRIAGGRTPGHVALSFVKGDSMLPYLVDGTPIMIEEMREFVEGGRYAIYYGDSNEDEIKRVERLSDKRIRISSDNKAFAPRLFEHVEDDVFTDLTNGGKVRLRVRGRVIFPPDMAPAVVGQMAEFAGKPRNVWKEDHQNRRQEMRLVSEDHAFTVFIRQNRTFEENFSVGLRWQSPDGGPPLTLLRVNGQHVNLSLNPNTARPTYHAEYHTHRLTEQDVKNSRSANPSFEGICASYGNLTDAIRYFLDRVNVTDARTKLTALYFGEE